VAPGPPMAFSLCLHTLGTPVLDILTAQDTAVEEDKLDGLYRTLGSGTLLLDEDIPEVVLTTVPGSPDIRRVVVELALTSATLLT